MGAAPTDPGIPARFSSPKHPFLIVLKTASFQLTPAPIFTVFLSTLNFLFFDFATTSLKFLGKIVLVPSPKAHILKLFFFAITI